MAAITAPELMAAVADRLKIAESSLPAYWPALCADAVAAANAEVTGRLQRRGYTAAQVAACDQLAFWTRSLGLFWALTHGGVYGGYEAEVLKTLDIRKDLDTATVVVSGSIVSPQDSNGAVVGRGSAVGTGTGSLFSWPSTDLTTNEEIQW